MYSQKFTVKVQMNNPVGLSYIVLGILGDGSQLRLTDQYISVAESPEWTKELPQLVKIIVEVKNNFGEISSAETPV